MMPCYFMNLETQYKYSCPFAMTQINFISICRYGFIREIRLKYKVSSVLFFCIDSTCTLAIQYFLYRVLACVKYKYSSSDLNI